MAFNKNIEFIPDEKGTAIKVKCPLIDEWIDPIDCMENRALRDEYILACFKQKENWRGICNHCPFSNY